MIEKTFNQLKEDIINSKNFYWYEYGYTTWETKAIIWKIVNILWTATCWIYETEKTDENMLKYINKILKAYKKIEKYTKLLTY